MVLPINRRKENKLVGNKTIGSRTFHVLSQGDGAYARWDWETSGLARYADSPEQWDALVERQWGEGMSMLDELCPSLSGNTEAEEAILRWNRICVSPAGFETPRSTST